MSAGDWGTDAESIFLRGGSGLRVCSESLSWLLHPCHLQTGHTQGCQSRGLGSWNRVGVPKQNRAYRLCHARQRDHVVRRILEGPAISRQAPRFAGKQEQAFGDNIYHKDLNSGLWLQADSHHSLRDGTPDPKNTGNDTKTDRVLISDDFVYWGGSGVEIPEFDGINICKNGQSHRSIFSDQVVAACIGWLRSFEETGYCGRPLKWD